MCIEQRDHNQADMKQSNWDCVHLGHVARNVEEFVCSELKQARTVH